MKSGNMNGVSFQNGRMSLPTGPGLGTAFGWLKFEYPNLPLKWNNHVSPF